MSPGTRAESTRFATVVAVVLLTLGAAPAAAQSGTDGDGEPAPNEPVEEDPSLVDFQAGVTLTSRFIYRGINLGEAPQVQPRLALDVGDFQVALWSSHPLAPRTDASENVPVVDRAANYREVNLWLFYDVDVGIGTLRPYVQNHYNPNAADFFDFEGGGDGAHYLQAQLMFFGDEGLPVDLLVGYVFYNDPGRSIYLEAGYRFGVGDLGFRVFAGGVPGESPFNGVATDEAAVTNIGVSASRSISVSDSFTFPLGLSFVLNPYLEDAYAAVSLSF